MPQKHGRRNIPLLPLGHFSGIDDSTEKRPEWGRNKLLPAIISSAQVTKGIVRN